MFAWAEQRVGPRQLDGRRLSSSDASFLPFPPLRSVVYNGLFQMGAEREALSMKPSVSCRSSEVRVALERRGRDAAVVTSLSQPGKQKSALESSTVSTFLRSEKNRRSFCSFRPETQSTVCQATYRGTCGIGTTRALAQLFSDHQGSLVTKSSSWIGHSLKFLRSEIRNSAFLVPWPCENKLL